MPCCIVHFITAAYCALNSYTYRDYFLLAFIYAGNCVWIILNIWKYCAPLNLAKTIRWTTIVLTIWLLLMDNHLCIIILYPISKLNGVIMVIIHRNLVLFLVGNSIYEVSLSTCDSSNTKTNQCVAIVIYLCHFLEFAFQSVM